MRLSELWELMDEANEVAGNLPIPDRPSWDACAAVVRQSMGTPDECGYQVFDNIVEALQQRATAHHSETA